MKRNHYKDLLILSHIRENGRKKLTILSEETKLPLTTIYDKLKQFRNLYIKKYTALLNWANLGFSTRALVSFKVDVNEKEILKDYLYKHRSVNTLYKVDNGFDFIAEVIFFGLEDLHNFLEFVEKNFDIKKISISNILSEVKKEDFMSNPRYLQIVSGLNNMDKIKIKELV